MVEELNTFVTSDLLNGPLDEFANSSNDLTGINTLLDTVEQFREGRITEYQYTSIRGWANIAGLGLVDILAFRASFSINSIPTATAEIAVGYNATDGKGGQGPTIDMLAANRSAVEIIIEVNGKNYSMFQGYLVGTSTDRSNLSLNTRIYLVHWLDDLRGTSALSDNRTTNALYDVNKPILILNSIGLEKTVTAYSIEGLYAKLDSLVQTNFGQLLGLAALDLTNGTVAQTQMSNKIAQQAFSKMFTNLRFTFPGAMLKSVRTAISEQVANAVYTAYNGGTLWSSLLRLTTYFGYTIVPLIHKTYLVAYTPVLKPVPGTTFTRLPADAYVYASEHHAVSRAIRGLVLYAKTDLPATATVKYMTDINAYYKDSNQKSGMLDAEPLPGWLANIGSRHREVKTSSGKKRGRAPIIPDAATVINPDGSTENTTQTKSIIQRFNESYKFRQDVGKAYAQLRYLHKTFVRNMVQLVGPLRMDIGPGTNLAFAVPDEAEERKSVLGYVNSVIIEVDSQKAKAATSYTVSHVRSEKDNNTMAMEGSPFYTTSLVTANLLSGNVTFMANPGDTDE